MINSSGVHLAIDLGASGGRVIAGQVQNGRLQMEAVARFANDPVFIQDEMIWNLPGLWRDICLGLRTATGMGEIKSVRSGLHMGCRLRSARCQRSHDRKCDSLP